MKLTPERLLLSERYHFGVVVEDSGHAFAGDLTLAPEGSSLVVRGDITGNRQHKLSWHAIDELRCSSFDATFVLSGLKGADAESRLLQAYPEHVGHFEIHFAVADVIFERSQIANDDGYFGFTIGGPCISQWVGMTQTQQKIIARSQSGTLFGSGQPIPWEFEIEIAGVGRVGVTYSPTMGRLDDDFTVGLRYPPAFTVLFDRPRSAAESIGIIQECKVLLSFLLGYPLVENAIELLALDLGWRRASLYTTSPRRPGVYDESRYATYPLGHNLSHDQLQLPQLPPQIFPAYFALPDAERTHVHKYLRYRELENPEERFLGFFRLLEKLCFQREFFLPEDRLEALLIRCSPWLRRHFNDKKNVDKLLKRLMGSNRAKLDTAGRLRRFMETLPESARDTWKYKIRDIDAICKLRNDLTHANAVEPEAGDVARVAKFVEVLLVIRLLVLLGVPTADATTIGCRIHQHFLIEHYEPRARPAM